MVASVHMSCSHMPCCLRSQPSTGWPAAWMGGWRFRLLCLPSGWETKQSGPVPDGKSPQKQVPLRDGLSVVWCGPRPPAKRTGIQWVVCRQPWDADQLASILWLPQAMPKRPCEHTLTSFVVKMMPLPAGLMLHEVYFCENRLKCSSVFISQATDDLIQVEKNRAKPSC